MVLRNFTTLAYLIVRHNIRSQPFLFYLLLFANDKGYEINTIKVTREHKAGKKVVSLLAFCRQHKM